VSALFISFLFCSTLDPERPYIHPNYGFLEQLDAFVDCRYSPTPIHPCYLKWKRFHARKVTRFLNQVTDTVFIIPRKLLLSRQVQSPSSTHLPHRHSYSEFPSDPCQAEYLLLDTGTTDLLTLTPARIPPTCLSVLNRHHHIELAGCRKDELLLALPEACNFVTEAIDAGRQVLVHCPRESTACAVVCASCKSFFIYVYSSCPDIS